MKRSRRKYFFNSENDIYSYKHKRLYNLLQKMEDLLKYLR